MALEWAKGKSNSSTPAPEAPKTYSELDISQARQWFEKAKTVFETRNYDYAIECYINGLERWPVAVEEGHKPLMFVALTRAGSGAKKAGAVESFRRSTTGKDAVKAMLNAEFLMAKDPKNVGLLEAVFKNAVKAKLDEVAMWIGPSYQDAAVAEKKQNPARYRLLTDLYVEIAEHYVLAGNLQGGIDAFQRAIEAMSRLRQADPKNLELGREQTELATRLTIHRGRYEQDGSFKDSVKDITNQKDIQDSERIVQGDERLDELIAKAREELQANPEVPAKVTKLVDLLCKREDDKFENQAIEVLMGAYRSSDNYLFKIRADDIRMRQMRRKSVVAKTQGDREAARHQMREQLRLELGVYQERVKLYPTDLRHKFEFGKRLFQAGKYDQAIPVLQEARNDPKSRTWCNYYVGRCFYEKKYFDQSIDVLTTAIEGYEMEGDNLCKNLYYWLGRSHEDACHIPDAMKAYGQLLQWDYNYQDVRQRMDNIRSKG